MEPARFLLHRPDEGGGAEDRRRSSTHLEHHEEEDDEDQEELVLLDIFVHEARGIHSIRIYGEDQDVYARLSLTSAPDDDLSAAVATRVARGGGCGATPRFAERLPPLRVRRSRLGVDVLKCELWTRSSCGARGGGVLDDDDQLLAFALVPLAAVAAADGARLVAEDFELSSTDLLHSPAGTVRLSLALRPGIPIPGDAYDPPPASRAADAAPSSIKSEVLMLGPAPAPAVDCSRIEFTDLRVEQESDAMAVQYLPFLRSADGPPETVAAAEDYCEMSTSPRGDKSEAASSDGSTSRNAAASTASTVSEDRAAVSSSGEATEKPPPPGATAASESRRLSPDTPTSRGGTAKTDMDMEIDMEAEQSAMQRQIMEMYVKSMQQFSESLAKMQLPIELAGVGGGVQKEEMPGNSKAIERRQAKKDGATRAVQGQERGELPLRASTEPGASK